MEKSLATLQAERGRLAEELSRVTCTCEMAFHDILAQSHRYHTSAKALQRIEAAGETSCQLIPVLRQDLQAFIRTRRSRLGQRGGGREDLGEASERTHELFFTEHEKRQVMEWMAYLVQETERYGREKALELFA